MEDDIVAFLLFKLGGFLPLTIYNIEYYGVIDQAVKDETSIQLQATMYVRKKS